MLRAALAALSLLFVTSLAQATKAVPMDGQVLVNTGAGYRVIVDAVELKPGDSVIANFRSLGSLVYPDGCRVEVVPGSIAWVEPLSPCTAAAARDPEPKLAAPNAFDPAWLRVGAALVGGGKRPAGP